MRLFARIVVMLAELRVQRSRRLFEELVIAVQHVRVSAQRVSEALRSEALRGDLGELIRADGATIGGATIGGATIGGATIGGYRLTADSMTVEFDKEPRPERCWSCDVEFATNDVGLCDFDYNRLRTPE